MGERAFVSAVWFYCTDRLSWTLLVSTPNTKNGAVLLCLLILREASVQKFDLARSQRGWGEFKNITTRGWRDGS